MELNASWERDPNYALIDEKLWFLLNAAKISEADPENGTQGKGNG